ncbi:MAG TPA: beta-ketoacyl synthase chain length factor [Desulfatiglandales bacterium]|nr:beta-ketoacyl synthase chain length factor [Desulfatiglandales bacterium]
MIVFLKGIAAIGPGFENWHALKSHFSGTSSLNPDFIPHPQGNILPGAERRRASFTVKLAVDVSKESLGQSGMKPEDMALVFASSNGDTNTIHQICEALATPERFVSPTRFHNSVHNAPAGYWSIASGSRQPSSSICAWEDSFSAGLVEAATQCLTEGIPVLLAAFDSPFPEPLYEKTPGHQPFGVALVLDSNPNGSLASITISVDYDARLATTRMPNQGLENMRCDSSASRSLPLLAAFASSEQKEVVLSYSSDLRLRIAVDAAAMNHKNP